jgi:hypothetical protein
LPPHHAETRRAGPPALLVPFREAATEIFVLLGVGSLLHAYNETEDALICASALMRFLSRFLLGTGLTAVITMSGVGSASNPSKHDCVSFADASKHVGATQCVIGTVLGVEDGSNGVTFLNFCQDSHACPFTVVVFPDDLRKGGDLRQLEGRQIEIKGTIQDHEGRVQIILRHSQQLGESAFVVVPPVPTDYDVERRSHYSAGRYSHPKAKKTKHKKQGPPISIEDPGEPQ